MHLQSQIALLLTCAIGLTAAQQKLHALIWNQSSVVCSGCPESIGAMLQDTPGYDISVTYVGPDQKTQFSDDLLKTAHIFAYPGGPDVGRAWKYLEPHAPALRSFVANGGRYLGMCLGAYLAGSGTSWAPGDGLDILPNHDAAGEETSAKGTQVSKPSLQTVIDINWTWGTGPNAGKTVYNRTMFFQDGDVIFLKEQSSARILGRYSYNGNVAVTVSPYGKGWVGASGVHLDAYKSWYTSANFTNPQGVHLSYGYDFVKSILQGFNIASNASLPAASASASSAAPSASATASSAGSATFRASALCVLSGFAFWWIWMAL